jgi:heterodisulfide reductase subunit C
VRDADNLPPYSADVKKSRSLNSPRPLWACMACNGCALPLPSDDIPIGPKHVVLLLRKMFIFYSTIVLLDYKPIILVIYAMQPVTIR